MTNQSFEILTDFPFELDPYSLMNTLRIRPGSVVADEFMALFDEAAHTSRPKALYRAAYVQSRNGDSVVIDGVIFTSRTLCKNLDGVGRVFPYIATCGTELEELVNACHDLLYKYWLDAIKVGLLNCSLQYLRSHLKRTYAPGKVAHMSPGSGDSNVWPLKQQKELFSLLGDVQAAIGVRLTDSYMMLPNKTVSGITYPSQGDFHTCQLCHRESCPNRRAPFDANLWMCLQDSAK